MTSKKSLTPQAPGDAAKKVIIIQILETLRDAMRGSKGIDLSNPNVMGVWANELLKFDLEAIKEAAPIVLRTREFFPTLTELIDVLMPLNAKILEDKQFSLLNPASNELRYSAALRRAQADIAPTYLEGLEVLYTDVWPAEFDTVGRRAQAIDVTPKAPDDACDRTRTILACTAQFSDDRATRGLEPFRMELFNWMPKDKKENPDGKRFFRLRCWVHITDAELGARFPRLDRVGNNYHGASRDA